MLPPQKALTIERQTQKKGKKKEVYNKEYNHFFNILLLILIYTSGDSGDLAITKHTTLIISKLQTIKNGDEVAKVANYLQTFVKPSPRMAICFFT